jgi:protein SCO1
VSVVGGCTAKSSEPGGDFASGSAPDPRHTSCYLRSPSNLLVYILACALICILVSVLVKVQLRAVVRALSSACESSLASLALLITLSWALTGCGGSSKHYLLQGQVLAKSDSAQQLTVTHGAIPGFMAAMTMPYAVKDPRGFQEIQPGDLITADLVVAGANDYWLERLSIKSAAGRGSVSSVPAHVLLPGERVPDVRLTNQDGKTIRLSRFRGKAVLITFIYTRCPFPTFCPLVSSKFAAIHKALSKAPAEYQATHLLSISLDPAYDTPPIMRTYGLNYLANDPKGFEHWDFVSTTPDDLNAVATAFGLEYFPQANLVPHSMNTILLATDGTVSRYWPGTDWNTSEVISALRQAIGVKDKR